MYYFLKLLMLEKESGESLYCLEKEKVPVVYR